MITLTLLMAGAGGGTSEGPRDRFKAKRRANMKCSVDYNISTRLVPLLTALFFMPSPSSSSPPRLPSATPRPPLLLVTARYMGSCRREWVFACLGDCTLPVQAAVLLSFRETAGDAALVFAILWFGGLDNERRDEA